MQKLLSFALPPAPENDNARENNNTNRKPNYKERSISHGYTKFKSERAKP